MVGEYLIQLYICDHNNIGYLVIMGIEKAFDSVDHKFILAVLSKAGFW